jgi:hypothetical protein
MIAQLCHEIPLQRTRRGVSPTTTEHDYSQQETQFLQAIDQYKRRANRPFPTLTEILEVLRSLGYVQTGERAPLPLEDRALPTRPYLERPSDRPTIHAVPKAHKRSKISRQLYAAGKD